MPLISKQDFADQYKAAARRFHKCIPTDAQINEDYEALRGVADFIAGDEIAVEFRTEAGAVTWSAGSPEVFIKDPQP